MDNEDIYRKARKRVKAKKGFFYHFVAYAGVLAMLYMILKSENETMLPVMIVALSWGIGLATHYLKTFGVEHLEFLGFSPDWEREELEKELENLTRQRELKERIMNEKLILDDLDEMEYREFEKRKLNRDFE